jgi:DNA adenine methylase
VLFYLDPPYMADTRSRAGNRKGAGFIAYSHELTDGDHARLLTLAGELAGMVVISGYPHALYDDLLACWRRVERVAMADGARPRTEVLWINPAATAALEAQRAPLFAGLSV